MGSCLAATYVPAAKACGDLPPAVQAFSGECEARGATGGSQGRGDSPFLHFPFPRNGPPAIVLHCASPAPPFRLSTEPKPAFHVLPYPSLLTPPVDLEGSCPSQRCPHPFLPRPLVKKEGCLLPLCCPGTTGNLAPAALALHRNTSATLLRDEAPRLYRLGLCCRRDSTTDRQHRARLLLLLLYTPVARSRAPPYDEFSRSAAANRGEARYKIERPASIDVARCTLLTPASVASFFAPL
jgi:hypothetical protein